ncbi:hypothetical protein CPC08DRAFT_525929 [Agrocybe pediades]|nr:hypothetical protein CPC08DRAFT_525929 [Agrocybe pediades]
MYQLPTELWLRVAHFIPDVDLYRLASVNRLFSEIVIERRYRDLILDDDEPQALIQKLKRLSDDPNVAARVRSLAIHPRAVRSACLRSRKRKSRKNNSVIPAKNQHWPGFFRLVYQPPNPLTFVLNTVSSLRTFRVPMEEDLELCDQLLEVFAQLPSVQEFTVEWKLATEVEASFCVPLLRAICQSLQANNLRTIRLELMLDHLCELVSSVTGLDHLEELWLHFACVEDDSERDLRRLADFINTLAPTLKSLSLSSIGHLNFSWLYSNLTYLPHLTDLSLLLPCDPCHITDPTGFNQFLRTHRDVSRLHFSPQYCCYLSAQSAHIGSQSQAASHLPPRQWLEMAFADVSFRNLGVLELGLNILGSGGKRVMLPIPRVAFAAKDVSRLSVVGCFGSLDDLREVLQPFQISDHSRGSPPRTLVLEVHVLNVELLDLLAEHLPGMETLDLTYRWVDQSGGISGVCSFFSFFLLLLIRLLVYCASLIIFSHRTCLFNR